MNRRLYLDLARTGLRMPIGTDLVLHEQEYPERVAAQGEALGKVVEQAARRYGTPLAFAPVEVLLELSLRTVLRSVTAQLEAGAEAVFIAEPAANVVYISPKQIEAGSDDLAREQVARLTCDLLARMKATGHPFILGSECDVLSVTGYERTIREKVETFLRCPCP